MESATAITNLLYRYAELMDAGDLEQVAGLFEHARVTLGGGMVVEGAAPMLEQWRAFVRISMYSVASSRAQCRISFRSCPA